MTFLKAISSMIIVAFTSAFVLSACNTTEGVGKDLESAGDAIKDTARDAK